MTDIDVQFNLRWVAPKFSNCELSHYTIHISGGIEGKVTLPPDKNEHVFKTPVKLTEESIFGDKPVLNTTNLGIHRLFQFQISADCIKENLTGEPSFFTSNLNKFKSKFSSKEEDSAWADSIFFRTVPKALIYDKTDGGIKVLDLDAKQVIQAHEVLMQTNSLDSNVQKTEIK